MRLLAPLAVGALAALCNSTAVWSVAAEEGPAAPSIEASRAALDDALVNYPETRFRNVRAVKTGFSGSAKSVIGYCGELNTQNRMGGFTGWSRFFLSPEPFQKGAPDKLYVFGLKSTLDDYSPGFTNKLVATFCGGSEEPLDGKDYSKEIAFTR